MRYLYISFFLCLIAGNSFSQSSVDSVATKGNPGPARFFIRCQATVKDDGPLWIADGVVVGLSFIRKIDPDDIESIDILKDNHAAAVYGNRPINGVVIITTKAARMRQFLVKDLLEGNGVPGATLTFISLKNEKDSLRFAADEQGIVNTTLLKSGEEYKVEVSSVGYKILSTMYKNIPSSKISQLFLAREVKEIPPVKIISYGYGYRCGTTLRCGAVGVSVTVLPDAKDSIDSWNLSVRLYPNPLIRGGSIRAEINIQEEKTLRLRTINLNGAELRSVVYRPFKGMNRIDLPTESQWAAGIYFIQVLDEKGKLLKQDKFLIQ
jgi:TonB-dependent SusC/RagA subfamily outer membrane receptor